MNNQKLHIFLRRFFPESRFTKIQFKKFIDIKKKYRSNFNKLLKVKLYSEAHLRLVNIEHELNRLECELRRKMLIFLNDTCGKKQCNDSCPNHNEDYCSLYKNKIKKYRYDQYR